MKLQVQTVEVKVRKIVNALNELVLLLPDALLVRDQERCKKLNSSVVARNAGSKSSHC